MHNHDVLIGTIIIVLSLTALAVGCLFTVSREE